VQKFGELDLTVVSPLGQILILEIKGGSVYTNNGQLFKDYKGEKPKSKDIKKQTSGDDHKGGYPYEGGEVGALQLEIKGYDKPIPVGDNYLPKDSFDSGFTPPNKQISSGWDAQPFDDGGFQDSFQSEQKKPLNNLGDLLQKHLIEKSLTSDR
jgi:hypothetical protein